MTTGQRLFAGDGDGRSVWGRRWRDLTLAHASDLGSYETLSEAQLSICRRVSTLEVELENMEGRKSAGMPVDIESKPIDPVSEFAKAIEGHVAAPVVDDDDEPNDEDEPLPIEVGLDREPGEA